MQTNESLQAVLDALKSAGSVLIFSHQSPDEDAIGSSVAAGLLLRQFGCKVDYALPADKGGLWRLFGEGLAFGEETREYYDIALVLDCSSIDYMHNGKMLSQCSAIVQVDHHTGEGFGDISLVLPEAAACAELVWDLYRLAGAPVSRQAANAMYLAISGDTGNFCFSNTTAKTFAIASALREISEDFPLVASFVKSYDPSYLDLVLAAIKSVRYEKDGKVGAIVLEYCEAYGPDTDTEGLVELIRQVNTVELAVFIRQKDNGGWKVSLRSEAIDVAALAARFGGGGHKAAAGFDTVAASGAEVLLKILELTEDQWTER